ncbi:MAG: ATP-binding protein [Clostridia bacterium]
MEVGKSYFTKLLILREYITDVKQYIFDPEGEYSFIAKFTNGTNVDFLNKDKFNILDITETDILKSNYLDNKVDYVYNFLSEFINMEENEEIVLNCIKNVYLNKGITEDINTMYVSNNDGNIYLNKKLKDSSYMPILEDIYTNMKLYLNKQNKSLKTIILKLNQLLDSNSFMNGCTTFKFSDDITVFNISNLEINVRNVMFKTLLSRITDIIKNSKVKHLIYIDEIWRFIYNNEYLSEKIFELFKTIRKLNAGIIVISQDISDFFSKDSGTYGKSILNNSFIKMFFRMEYSDTDILNRIGIFENEEINNIYKLNKGSCLMSFQGNSIILDVKSSKYENQIIKGEF